MLLSRYNFNDNILYFCPVFLNIQGFFIGGIFMVEKYMNIALTLAELGRGHTNPNPMVGSVIVKMEM